MGPLLMCSKLPHTATTCNTLLHTATHCKTQDETDRYCCGVSLSQEISNNAASALSFPLFGKL